LVLVVFFADTRAIELAFAPEALLPILAIATAVATVRAWPQAQILRFLQFGHKEAGHSSWLVLIARLRRIGPMRLRRFAIVS
jgi:hypothetical protein